MKGFIELSKFAVETVSSKCFTPSETENDVDTKNIRKMYGKIFKLTWSN